MRFLDRSSGNNAILVKGTWDGDKMAGKYSICEWMQCGDAFDLVDTPRAGFSSVREIIGKVRVCPMLKR